MQTHDGDDSADGSGVDDGAPDAARVDDSGADDSGADAARADDSGAEDSGVDDDVTPLLHVVLDRPAIAGNVGAVVRLCAATGAALHVCGSSLDPADRTMWRSGLDYWPRARVHFHDDIERCLALLDVAPWIVEVGGALAPWDAALTRGSVIVLGPEKGSVDAAVVARHRERVVTLPQRKGIRSLNLAQCAAVVVFEAVRQQTSTTRS